MEEYISLNEYCRRYNMGYNTVKQMVHNKELDYIVTESGYYKIKVGGDTVSRKLYEEEVERRIIAEQKLELMKKILVEV